MCSGCLMILWLRTHSADECSNFTCNSGKNSLQIEQTSCCIGKWATRERDRQKTTRKKKQDMRRGKKERRNSLSMVLIERAMAGVGVLITEGKGLRWPPQKKCIVNGSGISLTAGQDGTCRQVWTRTCANVTCLAQPDLWRNGSLQTTVCFNMPFKGEFILHKLYLNNRQQNLGKSFGKST